MCAGGVSPTARSYAPHPVSYCSRMGNEKGDPRVEQPGTNGRKQQIEQQQNKQCNPESLNHFLHYLIQNNISKQKRAMHHEHSMAQSPSIYQSFPFIQAHLPGVELLLTWIIMVRAVEAGAPGFEPRSTDPKSGVLPLHHAPINWDPYSQKGFYPISDNLAIARAEQ